MKKEQKERELMDEADKSSRRWHFAEKKNAAVEHWEVKREKERTKYSLDPLQFAKVETQKALEERQRRENNLMRDEDSRSRNVEEKERKEAYFKLCRERKRLRDIERRREANETAMMRIEDEHDEMIRRIQQKAEEYRNTLEQMQKMADQVANKQKDRLQEARNRTLIEKRNMHMMREDAITMERQAWEDEGTQLEKLLWSPQEATALRHMVVDYPHF
ncbi:hypothetical protein PInf_012219 [Phytophthora infestans]|nr:hypothetical protein PInf_012219 [Phytophthora infestans]